MGKSFEFKECERFLKRVLKDKGMYSKGAVIAFLITGGIGFFAPPAQAIIYVETDLTTGATGASSYYNGSGSIHLPRNSVVLAPIKNGDLNGDLNRNAKDSVIIGAGAVAHGITAESARKFTAIGNAAHVFGGQGTAVGSNALAADQATAIGNDVYAAGASSIAIGNDDISTKYRDIIPLDTIKELYGDPNGKNDTAKKLFRTIRWYSSENDDKGTHQIVDWNKFSSGYNQSDESGQRIFSPTYSGGIGSIAIGSRSISAKDGATAMGTLAYALGEGSTAMGLRAYTSSDATGAVAIGEESRSFAKQSLAVGNRNESTDIGAMSYGYSAKAVGKGSLAFGFKTYANASIADNIAAANGHNATNPLRQAVRSKLGNYSETQLAALETYQNTVRAYYKKISDGASQADIDTAKTAMDTAKASVDAITLTDVVNMSLVDGGQVSHQSGNTVGNTIKSVVDAVEDAHSTTPLTVEKQTGVYLTTKDSDGNTQTVQKSKSSGDNAIAIGYYASAKGTSAIAQGSGSVVDSLSGIGIGSLSYVSDKSANSIAVGVGAQVRKENSIAIGTQSQVFGAGAIGMGPGSRIMGDNSVGMGYGTDIRSVSAVGLGIRAFVGYGSMYATGLGANVNIGNDAGNSVALGSGARIGDNSLNSMAVGFNANVTQNTPNSIAFGTRASIAEGATSSLAVGDSARVTKASSTALGRLASADFENSVALGYRSTTHYWGNPNTREASASANASATNVHGLSIKPYLPQGSKLGGKLAQLDDVTAGYVSVGGWIDKDGAQVRGLRRIVNVAPGALDTDAVTVAQLRDWTDKSAHFLSIAGASNKSATDYADINDPLGTKDSKNAVVKIKSNFDNDTATGTNALALGVYAYANGQKSVALGPNAYANVDHGVAIGDSAQAWSEGSNGNAGVAIGKEAKAYYWNALALGTNARVSGAHSLAFGPNARVGVVKTVDPTTGNVTNEGAKVNDGIAIGRDTVIDGTGSVALGATTKVTTATNAVAIGLGAQVLAKQVDERTTAESTGAVALGSNASVTGSKYSVALGLNSAVEYNDTKDKTRAAFTNEEINDPGNGVVSVGNSSSVKRRIINVASGVNDNDAVTVKQLKAAASKYYSVNTSDTANRTVNGVNDVKSNVNNDGATGTGAVAVGSYTKATGNYSSAIGRDVITSAGLSTGIGANVTVSGQRSVGIGTEVQTTGESAIAIGSNGGSAMKVQAAGDNAIAIGTIANAYGTSSVALGRAANTGYSKTVTETVAGVSKTTTTVTGSTDAIAIGNTSLTENDNAIAIGSSAKVQRTTTSDNKEVNSDGSIAIGNNANVTGSKYSVALGLNSTVGYDDTKANTTAAFSGDTNNDIGNGVVSVGTSANNKNVKRRILNVAGGVNDNDAVNVKQLKSAVRYYKTNSTETANRTVNGVTDVSANYNGEGATGTASVTLGSYTQASGNYATAIGRDVITTGTTAVGIGTNVSAFGNSSVALGNNAIAGYTKTENSKTVPVGAAEGVAIGNASTVESNYAIAIGGNAKVERDTSDSTKIKDAESSVAIGAGAKVTGAKYSVALGLNARVNAADTATKTTAAFSGEVNDDPGFGVVSVGQSGKYRRILNVAGGVNDNDAVNVKQLKAAAWGLKTQSGTAAAADVTPDTSGKVTLKAGNNVTIDNANGVVTINATGIQSVSSGDTNALSVSTNNGAVTITPNLAGSISSTDDANKLVTAGVVNTALNAKANASDLAAKLDKNAELHVRAGDYTVANNGEVSLIQEDASGTQNTNKGFKIKGLATKGDITNINTTLEGKADKSYVDTQIGTVSNLGYKANGGTAKQVAVGTGLNFVQGDGTTGTAEAAKAGIEIVAGDDGKVTFGLNEATRNAIDNAASKTYVDTQVGNAANKDLDNLNDAGLNKVKDLAGQAVKVAPGKNVSVTDSTTDHVTTYTVDAIDTTVAAGDGLSVTGGDTVDTTTNKRNYTVALSADTQAKLAKVENLANTVGTNGSDGRDGKPGTGDNAGMGKDGLTKEDGLNGKDLTTKVNALRNGEAGTVVYTDENGKRVVKANDGKWYLADKVDATGNKLDGATEVTTPQARLVSPTGSTTTATKLSNIADGTIGENSKDAINGGQLHTELAKKADVTALDSKVDKEAEFHVKADTYAVGEDGVVTVKQEDGTGAEATGKAFKISGLATKTDITNINNTLADKADKGTVDSLKTNPITFTGDDAKQVSRTLGTELTVKGAANFTPSATDPATAAGVNIRVEKDATDGANGLVVKLADTLTKMKGISGNGQDDLVIKNGDNAVITVKPGATGTKGDVDFGGSKLTNVGTPGAGTDAANKDYVDAQVGTAANKDLDNLNDAGLNKVKDLAAQAVKVAPGKNVSVTDSTTDHVTTYTVDAIDTTVAAGDGLSVTGGDTVDTTTNKRNYTVALSADTQAKLAKVENLANTVGANGADGRDGKSGTGADAGMGKDGLTKEDGLNGKDLTTKVNALRNGEAGTVVYTDENGKRVIKAKDGKWYLADKVGADGTKADDAAEITIVQARLVNQTGSTTTATKLSNIADGEIGENSKDAINGGQLHTELAKKADVTALDSKVDKEAEFHVKADTYAVGEDGVVTVKQEDGTGAEATGKAFKISGLATKTDITNINNTLADKADKGTVDSLKTNPITFTGDDAKQVSRTLGTELTVKGAANFTPSATDPATAAGVNIRVEKDATDGANGLVVKLADTLTKMKGISGNGQDDLVIKNGDNAVITVKPGAAGTKGDVDFGGSKLTNVGAPGANTDAANKFYVDEAIKAVNQTAAGNANLGYKANSGTAKSVAVTTGLDFVQGDGTTATAEAAKAGIEIVASDNGKVIIGLSNDAKTKLDKVDTIAATVGANGADGRDGKAGTGKDPQAADATAGDKGLTGKDGLNGKDLTSKVNALRNGEAGTVVYTDENGNRLAKANDGKWYLADKVGADGTKADDAAEVTTVQARLVNPTGSTTTATKLSNIADGTIGENSKDAINGGQLFNKLAEKADKSDITTINNTLAGKANASDLNTLAEKTLTFSGDTGTNATRKLGETLAVKGAANFTPEATATPGVNIQVASDPTNGLTVSLADTLTKMKGISGNGQDDLVIKNGDNAVITVKPGATGTKGDVDFGGSKLTNVGTPGAGTDAANKDYVDAQVGTAANKDLDNLNDAGLNKVKDLAAQAVKVAPGKNVSVTDSTTDHVTTYTVDAIDTTVAAGDGLSVTGGDTVDTTTNKRNYTVALSADTQAKLAKVENLANTVGTNGSDGRDGKPGTGDNAGMGKDGLTKEDGLNGKDLTTKVNALRNGEAGTVVYTDENGKRVVKANDGKWYLADKVDATGNKLDGATEVTTPQARLVSPTGSTTTATKLSNIADGEIKAGSTDAINGGQLHSKLAEKADKSDITTINNTLAGKANASDLNTLAEKTLTFSGDTGTNATRKLGETLAVKGAANFTPEATATPGVNIQVASDPTNGLTVSLADTLTKMKGISGNGKDPLVITNGDQSITITPTTAEETSPDGTVTKAAQVGKVDFGNSKITSSATPTEANDLVNKGYLETAIQNVNNVAAGNANLGYKANSETGKTVNVNTGLHFKSGTGTIGATGADATTTNTATTKTGIAISTEDGGIVNIGLDEATRKVIDNAAKLGNTATDGRDGKSGIASGTTAAGMGAQGPTGQDGLNGKDLTSKVNALRNGEAGTVVYTDDQGNRLVKANDGKWYLADKVNADGTKAADAVEVTKPQARLVNPDGSTTGGTTIINNVASPIANTVVKDAQNQPIADALFLDRLKKTAADAQLQHAAVNVSDLNSTATEIVAKGLTFQGNDAQDIKKQLGETLHIVGEGILPTTTTTAANNIRTKKNNDGKLEIGLAKDLVGITSVTNATTTDGVGTKLALTGDSLTITNTQAVPADAAPGTAPVVTTVTIGKDGINAGNKVISNVAAPTNDKDAANKGYVDAQVGTAANKNLDNLNDAGLNKVKDLAAQAVKVAPGKNVSVTDSTTDHVTTYTVDAIDTTVAAGDGLSVTGGDTVDTTTNKRNYTVALSADTQAKLAKVENLANTVGTNGSDGRDGKPGTGDNAGMGKDGLTKEDGLNGKDLTTKVNALRNGEAGTVVYTDENGKRVVKANDGKWYLADKVDATGNKLDGATEVTTPQARLVSPTGSTTTATKLSNIADGTIGENSKDAINGGQLHTELAKKADVTALDSKVDKEAEFHVKADTYAVGEDGVVTVKQEDGTGAEATGKAFKISGLATKTDITNINNTLADKADKGTVDSLKTNPITFTGDDAKQVSRTLGTELTVKGAANFTPSATDPATAAGVNIRVEKDATDGANGLVVKLADMLTNMKGISGDGENNLVIKNGTNTITVTPGKAEVKDAAGTVTTKADPGTVNFGDATVTVKDLDAPITYRANSATDDKAKTVSLKKGLDFIAGDGTTATATAAKAGLHIETGNDGKVIIGLSDDAAEKLNKVDGIATKVANVESALENKADKSTVENLVSKLADKADKSELAGKADKGDVTALGNKVITFTGNKADETVDRKLGETLHLVGTNNITVEKDANKADTLNVTLASTLTGMESITTKSITTGTVDGLSNTTWAPTKVASAEEAKANPTSEAAKERSKAATQGQLKDVADRVTKGRVFTADTKDGNDPLKAKVGLGDTLAIQGGAEMTRLTDNNIGVELALAKDGKPDTMTVKLAKDLKMADGKATYDRYVPEFEKDATGLLKLDEHRNPIPKKDQKGNIIYQKDGNGKPIVNSSTVVDGTGTTYIINNLKNDGTVQVDNENKPVAGIVTKVTATGTRYEERLTTDDGHVIFVQDDDTKALNPVLKTVSVVDSNGIRIGSHDKPVVSLTKDGLNNGGNRITNVSPGIEATDAATVGQLQAVTNTVTTQVNEAGAHAAALAAMNPLSYDPLKKSQVMAGVGAYKGNKALALGVAHYANEDTMFNVGVSVGGGNNMMNAGVTYRFGGEDSMIPERYKGGPISSVYILQDEVSALKAENAQVKADNAQVKADNARMKENYEKVMQDNEEMKAQIKMLMAHMGIKS